MEKGKKFNAKIGHGFSNDKFGEGSVLVKVDAEGLKSIVENLQVGGSILLKFNKKTTKGNNHYFAEILPPFKGEQTGTGKTTTKTGGGYGDLD